MSEEIGVTLGRVDPNAPVGVPPAPFRDANLSWKAKGIYAWIATAREAEMADPRAGLARAGTANVAEVNAALDELVRHGYISRIDRGESRG